MIKRLGLGTVQSPNINACLTATLWRVSSWSCQPWESPKNVTELVRTTHSISIHRSKQICPAVRAVPARQHSNSYLANKELPAGDLEAPKDPNTIKKKVHKHSMQERNASEILQNLSPEKLRQLKQIQMEYEVWKITGKRVPDTVSDSQWLEQLDCPHTEAREHLYRYWAATAEHRKRDRLLHQEKMALRAAAKPQQRDHPAGLELLNTYSRFVTEGVMSKHYAGNLAYAAVHGVPLVFDMGFGERMTDREMKATATDLRVAHSRNKVSRDPFHFHFCGLAPGSDFQETLQRAVPLDRIPYTVTEESYLQHYPRDKLIYLSPNASTWLKEFNVDDVYVIGGLVDVGRRMPLTSAKAKQQNIRCAKFPLDLYLK